MLHEAFVCVLIIMNKVYEMWGSHSSEDVDCGLLSCGTCSLVSGYLKVWGYVWHLNKLETWLFLRLLKYVVSTADVIWDMNIIMNGEEESIWK
jgi:hypothetical protein